MDKIYFIKILLPNGSVWDSVEQLERFKKDWNIDGVIKKLQK